MNCYNHSNEVAVATCIDCGKGLCDECARMYTIPICNACNFIRIKVEKSSILKRWGIFIGHSDFIDHSFLYKWGR